MSYQSADISNILSIYRYPFFSYIEHLNDLEEPVINTNFNWSDYEIPNYVWIAITGLIVTAI